MPSGRPVLPATIDEDTDRKVREFCAENRVDASALVEALLRMVTGRTLEWPPELVLEVIVEAGRVMAERKSRRHLRR